MKQYRLKQWYPRIPVYLEDGYIISFDDDKGIAIYEFVNGTLDTFEMSSAELECTQYWELIEEEKPLFITEDGVDVHDNDTLIFVVKDDFKKSQRFALAFKQNKSTMKSFYHESNADEYIWRNKPLFSYEDFMKWGNVPYQRVIEQLAKERSNK